MALKSSFKGWLGETFTQFGMWIFLDSKQYRRVHNVIIEDRLGTTQLDHVIISCFGIFIIETKNMKGWIFGSENDKKWTQKLGGRSYKFQNPILQNIRHCRALAEVLGIDFENVHPIVFFGPDAVIKTDVPDCVAEGGLVPYIRRFKTSVFSEDEVLALEARLKNLKGTQISTREHVQNLQKRHNSSTCPRCGGELVKREGKFGEFIGCKGYPRCRYTREA